MADALEAIAVSLEMRGDPSCLDSLRRARTLARSPEEMLRVGASLVWMQIKFSVPQDSAGIRTARLLADSLLRAFPPGNAPERRRVGQPRGADGPCDARGRYGRDPSGVVPRDIPASLTDITYPFLAYAALGGPRDSLLALESRMAAALDGVESSEERTALRIEWLARPATLAFGDVHLKSLKTLAGMGDYLVDAEVAWTRRDTSAIDSILAGVKLVRRSLRPSDLTFDTLLPEAWLLMSMRKDQQATAWLDPTLARLDSWRHKCWRRRIERSLRPRCRVACHPRASPRSGMTARRGAGRGSWRSCGRTRILSSCRYETVWGRWLVRYRAIDACSPVASSVGWFGR